MHTQKTRILSWLTQRDLCGTTMLEMRIPRGAARIADLRADGWNIETRECTQHSHRTRQVEYVLHNTPGVMTADQAATASPKRLWSVS